LLRVKLGSKASKASSRVAAEGVVAASVDGTTGALVEVNCETDFVARNADFVAFAKDVALHVAAAAPLYLTQEDVPQEAREAELRVFAAEAADKPENVRERIAAGKLAKWYEGVVLLDQVHVNGDKHSGKTIGELQVELAAKTGENVKIGRFLRFAVGQ